MGSVNKVILVGNLGRDAELRYTPGGAPVATLNMATTEIWNDKGGPAPGEDRMAPRRSLGQDRRVPLGIPDQRQADLRRREAADAAVGRQGRQQALHDRGPGRSRGAARGRRRGSRTPATAHGRPGRDGRTHGRAGDRTDRRRYPVLVRGWRLAANPLLRFSSC